jgi:hypothetical protein
MFSKPQRFSKREPSLSSHRKSMLQVLCKSWGLHIQTGSKISNRNKGNAFLPKNAALVSESSSNEKIIDQTDR